MTQTNDCKTCREHLADLLLDSSYAADHADVATHAKTCTSCSAELRELHATFALLDEYTAPEPSAFFDTRLKARLREEQAAEPEGLWERMRSFFLFSAGRGFRPAVAGALAVVLLAGGASFIGFHGLPGSGPVTASSTVNDLKVLDNNESAEQQMGQLLDQSGAEDEDNQPT